MRNIIILLTMFLIITSVKAQSFITTWKTDNIGTSNPTSITIPTTGAGYNYDVDWNDDGVFDEFGIMGNVTHDFVVASTYTIRIRGAFPRIYFNCGGDKEKIISIDQWGANPWVSMNSAFSCCVNLVYNAPDVPNLSGVTDMSEMFSEAESFNGDLSSWDVSTVINMADMFSFAYAFNGDLSTWNVSNVTDMSYMFSYTAFNRDVSGWNVGNVTYMNSMFPGSLFNGDLSTWNVSKVIDMSDMFSYSAFNGDISSWIVDNVEYMGWMFQQNTAFNGDISSWNVSMVKEMNDMFSDSIFNGDISGWDVSSVTEMGYMFLNNTVFNADISGWNVSNVEYMNNMFSFNTAFNADISGWDVRNVTDMSEMFYEATSFDRDLGNWDISSVDGFMDMFYGVTLSTTNYDNTLIGWSTLTAGETQIPASRSFHGGNSTYCNGEAARLSLINDYNWSITDNGLDCTGLSLDDYNLTSSLKLYPNPLKDILHIKVENILERITVNDINGRVMQDILLSGNKTQENILLNSLSSGLYFVSVYTDKGQITKKIIKE